VFSIWGKMKKSQGIMSWEYGVDLPMECDACLKAAAQFGPSVRVCCHDEFVMTVQFPWLANG